MQNTKLIIEYDGSDFVGWQIQPNGPSIQGELEKALGQILQEPISTIAAGRTDAGVHARGQVASFKTSKSVAPDLIQRGVNGLLPPQIVVLSAEQVSDSFHARNSAKARIYRYHLGLRLTALQRNQCWYVGGYKIQEDLLQQCAGLLLKEHDFSSFCKVNTSADHLRCTVDRASWQRIDTQLVFDIRANRFLYGMVRALVGTMVEVARGHRQFTEFQEILEAKDRARAGASAPAKGLFLEEVVY
ncbi:MAG: tRNA pseudouridine(38-40) synthase TruA [Ignavibacteriales bacterium]|nr:tRNA pseudouridine(38-40) synthase TruA [Ignavibacteriales bacterium]